MSRKLDFTSPLSEEDKAYAAQFPGLHGQMVDYNDQQFIAEPESLDGDPLDADDDVPYTDWKLAELQAEVDDRNKERDADKKLPRTGTKAELAKVLEADDAEGNPGA